jgi:hypothetical protein
METIEGEEEKKTPQGPGRYNNIENFNDSFAEDSHDSLDLG